MTKVRLILAMALVTLGVSMIDAAAASANPEFLIEGAAITEESNRILLELETKGDYLFKAEPFGIKIEILCTSAMWLGAPKVLFPEVWHIELIHIEWLECIASKPIGCTVPPPLFELLFTLLLHNVKEIDIYFGNLSAHEGSVLGELTIEGCVVAGTYKVEGEQECELPNATTEAIEQEIVCKASGSKLKLGGSSATYEGTTSMELESELKLSASG